MAFKRSWILFGLIFLAVFFIGTVSAYYCTVEPNALDCSNNVVNGTVIMHMYADNSHSELATQSYYSSVLCCDFGTGDTTCTGNNKIVGLSSATNAHAEAPNLVSPVYNTYNVCYNGAYNTLSNCRLSEKNCVANNETAVVYLSSGLSLNYSNAHTQSPSIASYTTKICCTVTQQPTACTLTSATWQYENATEGTHVGITINGQNCANTQVSIAVSNGTACTAINGCTNPNNVVFVNDNTVSATWVAGPASSSRYYLNASVVSNPSISVRSSTPDILVTALPVPPPGYCDNITFCSDYNETYCNINACDDDIAQNSVPPDVDCNAPGTNCGCYWNASAPEPKCNARWDVTSPTCGDGIIEAGETCDGSNFGTMDSSTGCTLFDSFTGGTLSCNPPGSANECQINTSLCTGGVPGTCGDGVVNAGETCDGSDWGQIKGCGDFDSFLANNGQLTCGSNCIFNTSQCVNSANNVGTCYYTSDTTDTCQDDNRLDVNFTATWTWSPGNTYSSNPDPSSSDYYNTSDGQWHYDPQRLSLNCVNTQTSLICPAQIPLPFFNIYNLIAAILVIAVVYFAIESKRKKRKR